MFGNHINGKGIIRVWLTTAEEIGAAIGRNRHDIPKLVKIEDLPAFKFYGKWTALNEDLTIWSRHMAKKYGGKGKRGGPGPTFDY
jgi:hypothetical protein